MLGRLLGALPGAWVLPGPVPGPLLSSDEPDSRGGRSLPTLPRPSSLSNLCCRLLMTLFSSLVSPLAMSSSLWAVVATLAILIISVLAMSSSLCAPAGTLAMRIISLFPVSTSRSRAWTVKYLPDTGQIVLTPETRIVATVQPEPTQEGRLIMAVWRIRSLHLSAR